MCRCGISSSGTGACGSGNGAFSRGAASRPPATLSVQSRRFPGSVIKDVILPCSTRGQQRRCVGCCFSSSGTTTTTMMMMMLLMIPAPMSTRSLQIRFFLHRQSPSRHVQAVLRPPIRRVQSAPSWPPSLMLIMSVSPRLGPAALFP